MKNNNIFIKVGIDYHEDCTPIISDGKYFFALGDHLVPGRYEMCVEVADKYGFSKDNDSHFEDFKYFYDENGHIVYKMIQKNKAEN